MQWNACIRASISVLHIAHCTFNRQWKRWWMSSSENKATTEKKQRHSLRIPYNLSPSLCVGLKSWNICNKCFQHHHYYYSQEPHGYYVWVYAHESRNQINGARTHKPYSVCIDSFTLLMPMLCLHTLTYIYFSSLLYTPANTPAIKYYCAVAYSKAAARRPMKIPRGTYTLAHTAELIKVK